MITAYKNKTDQWSSPKNIINFYMKKGYKDFNPLKENYKNSLLKEYNNYYCNPPYSNIEPFIDYMIENSENGFESILLLPIRLNTNWFIKLYNYKCEIIILKRLKYGEAKTSAPFDSMLVKLNKNIKEFKIYFERDFVNKKTNKNIQITINDIIGE